MWICFSPDDRHQRCSLNKRCTSEVQGSFLQYRSLLPQSTLHLQRFQQGNLCRILEVCSSVNGIQLGGHDQQRECSRSAESHSFPKLRATRMTISMVISLSRNEALHHPHHPCGDLDGPRRCMSLSRSGFAPMIVGMTIPPAR